MEYRIKEIAENKGVSIKQLAELCGLSLPSLYNIANGKLAPKVSTLENIANALGVSITELFDVKNSAKSLETDCPCCKSKQKLNEEFQGMQREAFYFYRSFMEAMKKLPDANRLKLYDAIVKYALDGVLPNFDSNNFLCNLCWKLIVPQLDANWRRFLNGNKGTEHGKQGGNPNFKKGQTNPYKQKSKQDNNPKDNPKNENTEKTKRLSLLNSQEACAFLCVSPRTLDKLKKNGDIHYYKTGTSKQARTLYLIDDLQAYMDAHRR